MDKYILYNEKWRMSRGKRGFIEENRTILLPSRFACHLPPRGRQRLAFDTSGSSLYPARRHLTQASLREGGGTRSVTEGVSCGLTRLHRCRNPGPPSEREAWVCGLGQKTIKTKNSGISIEITPRKTVGPTPCPSRREQSRPVSTPTEDRFLHRIVKLHKTKGENGMLFTKRVGKM